MAIKHLLRNLLFILILASNVGCDQISKAIVRNKIAQDQWITVIDNHLFLTKVENSGAFLSLGNALPPTIKLLLLTIFPILILGFACVYLFSKRRISNLTSIGICFVIGGGIGNIYDRVCYGSVTDFLHIDFVLFRTGIFNMADVSIMLGMLLVFFASSTKSEVINCKL